VPNTESISFLSRNQSSAPPTRVDLRDLTIAPEEFWAQAEQQGECWVWVGEKFNNGYGKLRRPSRSNPGKRLTVSAHRYSYYLAYDYDPGLLYTCHHCDCRSCLRPDHLFLGTNLANMHDISRKRRVASADMEMPPDLRAIIPMLYNRAASRAAPFANRPRAYIFERGDRQFMVNMKMHGARFSRTFETLDEAQGWRDMIFRLLSAEQDTTKGTQWAVATPLLGGPNWTTDHESLRNMGNRQDTPSI